MGFIKEAARVQSPAEEECIREPRQGWVVCVGPGRQVWVDYPGNSRGPLLARTSPTLDVGSLRQAASSRLEALLLFADGDPTRPCFS